MKKRVAVLALVLVLVAVYIWRYTAINSQYPPPQEEVYGMGDVVTYKDFEIVVTGTELIDAETISKMNAEIYKDFVFDGEAQDIIVEMEVTNRGKEEQDFDASRFDLEAFGWRNGSNCDYLTYTDDIGPEAHLKPGETKTVKVGYAAYVGQYKTRADWEAIEPQDFYVRISSYPVKKIIELKEHAG